MRQVSCSRRQTSKLGMRPGLRRVCKGSFFLYGASAGRYMVGAIAPLTHDMGVFVCTARLRGGTWSVIAHPLLASTPLRRAVASTGQKLYRVRSSTGLLRSWAPMPHLPRDGARERKNAAT